VLFSNLVFFLFVHIVLKIQGINIFFAAKIIIFVLGEYTGVKFDASSGRSVNGEEIPGSLQEMEKKFRHMVPRSHLV
jgi:hypothetical protein